MSMAKLVESPHPIVHTKKPAIPTTNNVRCPNNPPSQPSRGMTRVRAMRKPVITHCVAARSAPNVAMSRGIARVMLLPANVWVPEAMRTIPATSHL